MPATYTASIPWFDQSRPSWVSADVAFKPDGTLNEELFHASSASSLRANLVPQPYWKSTCIEYGEDWLGRTMPPDRSTFEKAVQNSELIVLGKISDKEFGFFFGVPGQLVRLEPVEYLKGKLKTQVAFHYFFFPVGTFDSGPHRFCKTDGRVPESPLEVGDEALLLIEEVGESQEPFLDLKAEETFILLKLGGAVSSPKRFAEELGQGVEKNARDTLLSRMRGMLRRGT